MTVNNMPSIRTELVGSAQIAAEKIARGFYEFRYMIRGSNGVVMQRVRQIRATSPVLPKETFLHWRVEDEVFDLIMSWLPTAGSVGAYLATGVLSAQGGAQ